MIPAFRSGAIAFVLAGTMVTAAAAVAQPRDQIMIVGSSTVFPYSQAVAEDYASMTGAKAPVVEATGTGGGMKVFCGGVGTRYPDITGASRAMKLSEHDLCTAHGVEAVTEILIGFDGLTIAHSIDGPDMALSKQQLFLALAAEVEVDGAIVSNPFRRWNEIDPALPDAAIQVFGPPPTSGTRDAFIELVMEPGCTAFLAIAALPDDTRHQVCQRMRQDGPFIEAGENDNIIVQRLDSDAGALGIFGYSFLYENTDRLKPVAVDGIAPDDETIASGQYALARPLYLYVKNAHRGVIPGLNDFLAAYVAEESIGPDGYLPQRGLIPLPDVERARVRAMVAQGVTMDRFH